MSNGGPDGDRARRANERKIVLLRQFPTYAHGPLRASPDRPPKRQANRNITGSRKATAAAHAAYTGR